jgi:hypothetical protein
MSCFLGDSGTINQYDYTRPNIYQVEQWWGPTPSVIGFGGRGPAAHAKSAIAAFADIKLCVRGYIYQAINGSLAVWATDCHGYLPESEGWSGQGIVPFNVSQNGTN